MRLSSSVLVGVLLLCTSCDVADEESAPASSFTATVAAGRTAVLSGEATTSTYTFGMPRRQILLDAAEPGGNEGGVTFTRAYETTLQPGTFDLNTGAALGSGFSATLTLPRAPTPDDASRAESFFSFSGTLTLTEVTPERVRGAFSFRAHKDFDTSSPEVVVGGSFVASVRD